jgi:prepilin-type N-terminal cleavage/methylation domain-containing protein
MRKGFTLVEILVVVAIMTILAAIVLGSFRAFRSAQGLEKDTELIVEVLRQARSQTLTSQNGSSYGVYFASSTIALFAGTTYNASDTSNQNFFLINKDVVLDLNLTGESRSIVFNRLTGETVHNGTIIISSPSSSKTKTITVYKTGLIEFQ